MEAARSYMRLIGSDLEDFIASLPNYLKNSHFLVTQGLKYAIITHCDAYAIFKYCLGALVF